MRRPRRWRSIARRPSGPAARLVLGPRPTAGLYVHVAGAVRRPGLMQVPDGARVAMALERAGGPTRRADLTLVNLAARLQDGQQIVVPERGAAIAPAAPGPGPPVRRSTSRRRPSSNSTRSTASARPLPSGSSSSVTKRRLPVTRRAVRGRRNRREAPRHAARRTAAVTRTGPGAEARRLVAARPLHLGVGSLAAGLALSTGSPRIALGAAASALIVLLALRLPALGAVCASLVLTGAAVGDARLAALDAPADRVRDGPVHDLRAHLVTRPRASAFGSSAEVEVAGGRLSGARLLIRVARWTRLPPRASIGAELVLTGRLRPLGATQARRGLVRLQRPPPPPRSRR